MSAKSRFEAFVNHRVRVAVHGNREMVGTLMAFDQHLNLVLNDAEEIRKVGKRADDARTEKRALGMIILRGEEVIHFHSEGSPASTGVRTGILGVAQADPAASAGLGRASTATAGGFLSAATNKAVPGTVPSS
ncbi:LSM domain [Carpediemonas membranifera]|uniref:Sm protein B n=1 Tax=Carpediemonas membranifera TaxID=201153 RepID=A0A8J6B754_9EUKA|nr:LSM domain [Carpediemonas membranifera]|eukprot:KAG9395674.1 LSM domain [Carpediemonas membranifera]